MKNHMFWHVRHISLISCTGPDFSHFLRTHTFVTIPEPMEKYSQNKCGTRWCYLCLVYSGCIPKHEGKHEQGGGGCKTPPWPPVGKYSDANVKKETCAIIVRA